MWFSLVEDWVSGFMVCGFWVVCCGVWVVGFGNRVAVCDLRFGVCGLLFEMTIVSGRILCSCMGHIMGEMFIRFR